MAAQQLWNARPFPTKLHLFIEHLADKGEDTYSVRVSVENNKGSGGGSVELHWPEGALDLIGPAVGAVADQFVFGEHAQAVTHCAKVQHGRARMAVWGDTQRQ